ncbi:MAG: hypothetical protein USCGTAYLOR_02925 [Chromatiales bacterium USCg_Taylor]|nr:MAG: hypothetical protein USCGTAYLOR_02925 [Chromatiales bacterium USCg_Taylor]
MDADPRRQALRIGGGDGTDDFQGGIACGALGFGFGRRGRPHRQHGIANHIGYPTLMLFNRIEERFVIAVQQGAQRHRLHGLRQESELAGVRMDADAIHDLAA